ncbi:MAG: phosphatase PAP2 family protein [Candidatus Levybacteria bacterium]|nr:phosphatase PAP2 family protein [Candidatus Levybacteria bacterium]
MTAKSHLVLLGFFLFFSFLVVSVLVFFNLFYGVDSTVTVYLQKYIPRSFDLVFSVFSIIGTLEIATLFLLILLFFFKKLNKIFILFGYGVIASIEIAQKTLIFQKGPPLELLRTNLFLPFPTGEITHDFFAYPSGHSSRTAFISAILIFLIISGDISSRLKKLLIGGIIFFDLVMFVSRIYLAEHWFSDVIGGIMLGFSLGILSLFLKPLKFSK